jgi:hypothetical protein
MRSAALVLRRPSHRPVCLGLDLPGLILISADLMPPGGDRAIGADRVMGADLSSSELPGTLIERWRIGPERSSGRTTRCWDRQGRADITSGGLPMPYDS